ncbi:MAG TPA: hypothetical protein VGE72_06640 [Azospirillum sp.]
MDAAEAKRTAVEEHGGILPAFEVLYLLTLADQCERAMTAWARGSDALERNVDNHITIFSEFQEFVARAAALHRYFWPASGDALAQARAATLRAAFAVADDGALRRAGAPEFRLDRIEERLDAFQATAAGRRPEPSLIAPERMLDNPGTCVFRLIDPEKAVFVVLGTRIELFPLHSEIQRLYDLLQDVRVKCGRLPPSPRTGS